MVNILRCFFRYAVVGLYSIEPRQATIGKFRNFTAIGETKLTFVEIRQILAELG